MTIMGFITCDAGDYTARNFHTQLFADLAAASLSVDEVVCCVIHRAE